MPVRYEIDPASGRLCTTCAGAVTLDEVLAHFRELAGDASLPARVDVLLDLSEVESIPASDQLRSIAGEIERLRARVKWGACAIVATRDALYGMSRVFQVLIDEHFVRSSVFREREEAERWLGPPRPPAGARPS